MDAFRGAAEKGILQTKHFTAAAAADIAIAHRPTWMAIAYFVANWDVTHTGNGGKLSNS